MIPIIKQSDAEKINLLINNPHLRVKSEATELLQKEIARAKIISDAKIQENIIQLDSYFEVKDIATGKLYCLTLTTPNMADAANKKISVLSPLGVALIGFKEGDELEWKLPGGIRKLKIEKVAQSN